MSEKGHGGALPEQLAEGARVLREVLSNASGESTADHDTWANAADHRWAAATPSRAAAYGGKAARRRD